MAEIARFKIVIEDNCWHSRVCVGIEPRQVDRPSRSFRSAPDAVAFADELSRIEGWQIEDRRQ